METLATVTDRTEIQIFSDNFSDNTITNGFFKTSVTELKSRFFMYYIHGSILVYLSQNNMCKLCTRLDPYGYVHECFIALYAKKSCFRLSYLIIHGYLICKYCLYSIKKVIFQT